MAITTNTRFSRIVISGRVNSYLSLYAAETDSVRHLWFFGLGNPILTTEQITDLATLQAIHASSDGIRDADDNATPVYISDIHDDYVVTPEDLPKYGLFNPLDADSYATHLNLSLVMGALASEASVTEDAITGRRDMVMKGGVVPKLRVPSTLALSQDLGDWEPSHVGGDRVSLRLVARSGETFVEDTVVQDDIRLRAMAVWLQGARQHTSTGSAVYTPGNQRILVAWSELNLVDPHNTFSFDQSYLGEAEQIVIFDIPLVSIGQSGITIQIRALAGSATMSTNRIRAYLQNRSLTLETDRAEERPPWGSTLVESQVERVIFGGAEFKDMDGYPVWQPAGGDNNVLGSAYGRILDWEDLETVPGATHRVVPAQYGIRGFHDGSTYIRHLRILDPEEWVPFQGIEQELEIRKEAGVSGKIEVHNKFGDHLTNVAPGESLLVRGIWHSDGSREVYVPHPITKTYILAGANIGALSGQNYYTDSSTTPTTYYRPIDTPFNTELTIDSYDVDVFSNSGHETHSNGETANVANLGKFLASSVKVLKAGRLVFTMILDMSADGSGTFDNHRLVVFKNGVAESPSVELPAHLGDDEGQTWRIVIEFDVDADDVITPMVEYPQGTTMSPNDIDYIFYYCQVDLTYNVVEKYAV